MPLKTNCLKASLKVAAVAWLTAATCAYAFDVRDTGGTRHRLADYKGKWVVVNFWATWCTPCIQEIPEIAEFSRERSGRDAVVIGIALDVEDAEKTKQFAAKVGHAYPLVLGDEAAEKQFGKVKGLPTTVIFDPRGKRVYDRLGRVTRRSLEEVTGRAPERS